MFLIIYCKNEKKLLHVACNGVMYKWRVCEVFWKFRQLTPKNS